MQNQFIPTPQPADRSNRKGPASLAVCLLLCWAAIPFVVRYFAGNWDESGKIGDTFGLTTSLFTGLGLLAATYTIWMQSREFARQEAEMRNQQQQSTAQLYQLVLSTQLQSSRALIEEHRSAISELNPAIRLVPTSASLLKGLRAQTLADAATNISLRKHSDEIVKRIDDLAQLQAEILEIRALLTEARAAQSAQKADQNE